MGPDDPADGGVSPNGSRADASGFPAGGNRQQLFLICEALDLVVSAQGYNSPAVPPLLHALIGAVRVLRAAPTAPTEAAPDREPAATTGPRETEAPAPEPRVNQAPPAEVELNHRLAATERKVAALTDAVSRLVEHLERRRWSGLPGERRAEVRLPGIDAAVYIDRQRYRVVDWSKSGFCIQVGEGDLVGRRRLAFRFTLELLDETIEFQGYAMPVRREGNRLAARFVQLDAAVQRKLAEVVRRLAGEA